MLYFNISVCLDKDFDSFLRKIYIIFCKIFKARIDSRMRVDIARAHLSHQINVYILRIFVPVDVTDSSGHFKR